MDAWAKACVAQAVEQCECSGTVASEAIKRIGSLCERVLDRSISYSRAVDAPSHPGSSSVASSRRAPSDCTNVAQTSHDRRTCVAYRARRWTATLLARRRARLRPVLASSAARARLLATRSSPCASSSPPLHFPPSLPPAPPVPQTTSDVDGQLQHAVEVTEHCVVALGRVTECECALARAPPSPQTPSDLQSLIKRISAWAYPSGPGPVHCTRMRSVSEMVCGWSSLSQRVSRRVLWWGGQRVWATLGGGLFQQAACAPSDRRQRATGES